MVGWLETGIARAFAAHPRRDTLQTEVAWICGYCVLLGLFYLFHAPFRSHVVVRTDWYARLTRITQLWSLVVLFTLHSVPSEARRGPGRRPSAPALDDGSTQLVFFPVLLFMTLIFALLHKGKRRLQAVLTYGATFMSLILNSLVAASLCTAHYAYTQHLLERVTLSHLWYDEASKSTSPAHRLMQLAAHVICPGALSTTPLWSTAHLVVVGALIIYADYQYKKRCGYDTHAGLLWSDVFEVNKRPVTAKSCAPDDAARRGGCEDFRYNEKRLVPVLPKAGWCPHAPMDFSLDTDQRKMLLDTQFPVARAAMVSWLTAFAVGAYIQSVLTNLVSFVTNEARSITSTERPKIFDISQTVTLDSDTMESRQTAGDMVAPSRTEDNPAVWFDWVADVGDGFNSTYEVARLLAQPRLRFQSGPPHSPPSGTPSPPQGDEKKAEVLPRGSFVVIGGDLAYPNPSDETYTTRLFEPYRDALPGNPKLRKLFHARQMELVRRDDVDADVAHIHVLDAETVAAMACGADTLRASRGTAEEALHSVPLLFAIPGNHDWFDGLRIFRKYMLEKTWIGGWLMPQRSSFFVLRLPYNWFMLCCDTGNEKDIDVAQRNYFRDVIEKYMDASSCVILCSHEPGWIQDAWPSTTSPSQPQLAALAQVLGTRLRLRLAGDIHNYSRHVPTTERSENPMLVTCGGGGAFLHEATRGPVVAFGERYRRACVFPPPMTLFSFLPHLWGFRVSNWKFDLLLGVGCFLFVMPVLLTPVLEVEREPITGVLIFVSHCLSVAATLFASAMLQCGVSVVVFLIFFGSFLASTSTGAAPMWGRLPYCLFWTLCVSAVCYGTVACLRCTFAVLIQQRLLLTSSENMGDSVLERECLAAVCALLTATAAAPHWCGPLARLGAAALSLLSTPVVSRLAAVTLRCFDPFEMLAYTAHKLRAQTKHTGAGGVAESPLSTDRLQTCFISVAFHTYFLLFFWMTAIPLVSLTIGCFLMLTTRLFQSVGAYDAAYSSFQIEDYKSFMRFKIDGSTRALHGYTIGVRRVPKLWIRDERCVRQYTDGGRTPPPHLQRFPSRWIPSFPELSRRHHPEAGTKQGDVVFPWDKKSKIVDQFVCFPHSLGALSEKSEEIF